MEKNMQELSRDILLLSKRKVGIISDCFQALI